jgi:hypothetical protein
MSQPPEKGAEYPQTGQPPLKRFSAPVKPQAGQRTEAKNLPQWGHLSALRGTSSPQFSQKNRGAIFYKYTPAGIANQVRKLGNFDGYGISDHAAVRKNSGIEKKFAKKAPDRRPRAFYRFSDRDIMKIKINTVLFLNPNFNNEV